MTTLISGLIGGYDPSKGKAPVSYTSTTNAWGSTSTSPNMNYAAQLNAWNTYNANKTAAAAPPAFTGNATTTNNGVTSFSSDYLNSLGPNLGVTAQKNVTGGGLNAWGSPTPTSTSYSTSDPSWLSGLSGANGLVASTNTSTANPVDAQKVTLPGGQTGYYVPGAYSLNEGTQYLSANLASQLGGTALSYVDPVTGQVSNAAKSENGYSGIDPSGYLFAYDPSQALAPSTGVGGGYYTPGVSGGQDLKDLATVAAIVGTGAIGGIAAPAIAGALGAGAAGVAGAGTGAVLGAGLGGAAANANNNASADPLGTLTGAATGAVLGGVGGGVGGQLLGGASPTTDPALSGANAVTSGANGGLGVSEDLGTASLAPGQTVSASGNVIGATDTGFSTGGTGTFGGGLSSGGQIADSASTAAAAAPTDAASAAPTAAGNASFGGAAPTDAASSAAPTAAGNASPASFGGATPSDAQLLSASVPYAGPDPLADTSYLSGLDTSAVAGGADAASSGATGGLGTSANLGTGSLAAGATTTAGSGSGGVLGTIQNILGAGGAASTAAKALGGNGGSNVAGGTATSGTSPLAGVVAGAAGLLNPAKGFTYNGPGVPASDNAAMEQANQQGAQGVMQTFNALNQPNFTMDKMNLDTQLRNQGIYPTPTFDPTQPIGPNNQPGAYEQAMSRLTTSQNQLTAANEGEAGALGLTAASNLFKNQISANQTAFPEAEAAFNAASGQTTAQNQNIGSVLGPVLSAGLQVPAGQTSGTNFANWLNSLFSS